MKESTDFKPIAILKKEKIKDNVSPTVSFQSAEKGMPIAPMVTTEYILETSEMFFRIMAYVDNENTMEPIIESDRSHTAFRVVFNSHAKFPQLYTLWYFEAKLIIPINGPFEMMFFNYNLDPRTSRGTVVVVSPEVPAGE